MVRETSVQDRIVTAVKRAFPGSQHTKTHGSPLTSGEPDLLFCIAPWGYHCGIEVKGPDGTVSYQQQLRIDQYRRAGSMCFACNDPKEAVHIIETLLLSRRDAVC